MTYLKPLKAQVQNFDQIIPYTLSSYFELVGWAGALSDKANVVVVQCLDEGDNVMRYASDA